MSQLSDFVIENNILIEYVGKESDVVVPEGVINIKDVFSEAEYSGDASIAEYYGYDTPVLLTSVVLPESMTSIGWNAFSCCKHLKKVVLPDTLEKIGSYAFDECIELSDLTIPDSVVEIGDRAFAGCTNLNIMLPPHLKTIEEASFRGCALTSIVIPEGVTEIGKDAFKGCNKIKSAGPVGGGYDYEFHWTDEIPDNAFSGLRKLKKVVLPATIKKVGNNAFKDCKELTDVTMPKTAKVSKTAFKGCNKLGEIKEPSEEAAPVPKTKASTKKKKTVPDFAVAIDHLIQYNGHDADVVIPEGVAVIGKRSFYWNKDIVSVTVPASVHTVEQEAFCYCTNLEQITFLGSIEKVGALAFGWLYDKPSLELHVYSSIPIVAFSKAAQDDVVNVFCRRFSEFNPDSEIFKENLKYIGAHLKQKFSSSDQTYGNLLVKNAALRHAVLDADAVSAKDADWLLTQFSENESPEIVGEFLNYKNRLLKSQKIKKSYDISKKRDEEKELSFEMTVEDWRKVFKFSYVDGDIIIKETRQSDDILVVPAAIGAKKVRIIGFDALDFGMKADGKKLKMPKKIMISEGIEEILPGAICIDDADIHIPSTITEIPEGLFAFSHNVILHLPASVVKIGDNLSLLADGQPVKEIHAPKGSYAETYAKEHGIPVVIE